MQQSRRQRLFIAANLALRDQPELARWVNDWRALAPETGLRWLADEHWHLTLRFIGDTDRAAELDCALKTVVRGPPVTATLTSIGPFPRRRPTVIAAQFSTGKAMAALHADVEAAISRCGFNSEVRRFLPHISVARLNQGQKTSWPTRPGRIAVQFDRIVLYRSELKPSGARYHALSDLPLNEI